VLVLDDACAGCIEQLHGVIGLRKNLRCVLRGPAAGIDPSRAIPVVLDVGTNNGSLLQDPQYLGLRERRARGEQYQEFVHRYIATALKLFPNALLDWEDFSAPNARWILNAYRSDISKKPFAPRCGNRPITQ